MSAVRGLEVQQGWLLRMFVLQERTDAFQHVLGACTNGTLRLTGKYEVPFEKRKPPCDSSCRE